MAISRNLEKDVLYISKWLTGLYTQRSPLFVPLSAMGLQIISRLDTLWDGENTDLSSIMTLIRRPGFSRYCSAQLAEGEIPLGFFSFKNTSGTIKAMLDTNQRVAYFTGSAITTVYSKGTTVRTSFTKVGDNLFTCDGTNAKRWDGTTLGVWGLAAPATAPTIVIAAGTLTAFKGYTYVYVYRRSATGEISSASPISGETLALSSKEVQLSGARSTDSTVDKVQIYRIRDGGSVYYYVAEIANPGSGTWSYTDNLTDAQLNDDIVAPMAHLNDPPPTGISLSCFHLGRIWVAEKNHLHFGGGPQVTNGSPESAFPPANVMTLAGNITAMVSTSAGLCVWTADDFYVVYGSDLASFIPKKVQANFGVQSQNCVCQDGDLLFVFTSRKQLFTFSGDLVEIGFNIRNRLAAFDPTKVVLVLHRSGADEGLFISNGTTDVYRYSIAQTCFSNVYKPVGGVGIMASIEVGSADYRLMLGRASAAGYLLARDPSSYADDGSSYTANAVIGSLILASPGQVTPVKALILEAMPVGTYPTISVLLNEVSGTYSVLPNPVPDPPLLPATTTVWSKRHDLAACQTPLPRLTRHLFVKIAFPSEATANEVLGLAVQSE